MPSKTKSNAKFNFLPSMNMDYCQITFKNKGRTSTCGFSKKYSI